MAFDLTASTVAVIEIKAQWHRVTRQFSRERDLHFPDPPRVYNYPCGVYTRTSNCRGYFCGDD